jgi:Leucine-rich repeat (LRR) protein
VRLNGLKRFDLTIPEINDAMIVTLRRVIPQISALCLNSPNLTDVGVAELAEFPNLENLAISSKNVTDATLRILATMPRLTGLEIASQRVTDEGISALKPLTRLAVLTLQGTRVTALGVASLRSALPDCRVDWDGESAHNRAAAEWVLQHGGTVQVAVDGKRLDVAKLADLPKGDLRVTQVALLSPDTKEDDLEHVAGLWELELLEVSPGLPPITIDHAATHLRTLHNIQTLKIGCLKIGDAGFDAIRSLPRLTGLVIFGPGDDRTLARVGEMTGLTRLEVYSTEVTDRGIVGLKNLTKLGHLGFYLAGPQLTDAGVAVIAEFSWLPSFAVHSPAITNSSLVELSKMPNLETLSIHAAKITNAGLKSLRGSHLKSVEISYCDAVNDAGLKELQGMQKLRMLRLAGPTFTDAGMKNVVEMPLTNLTLHACGISDRGLTLISRLDDLTYLAVSQTAVTDTGARQLKTLKKLQTLALIGTKVTAAGVAELQAALPNCQISR